MSGAPDFTTPREAHRAIIDAGALFEVRRRDDALGFSFSYRVTAAGDAPRCREILASVKARPPVFFEAFKAAVQASAERGAA